MRNGALTGNTFSNAMLDGEPSFSKREGAAERKGVQKGRCFSFQAEVFAIEVLIA